VLRPPEDVVSEKPISPLNEKRWVALTSVVAAVFLTTFKAVVGVATGSLGILSEAAHSGLDLIAAVITFLSVSVSDRPADETHAYGHGKVENFSALVEALLLLLTCAWIIFEAFRRLFFTHPHVDPTVWAFAVMVLSIGIDLGRSRALYRVARKYRSEALEADALHFSTDVWSSSVVILGLAAVWMGQRLNVAWLRSADPLAALGVAGVVIYVSSRLGKRTLDALLDATPVALRNRVAQAVEAVEGVLACTRIRMRRAGNRYFLDVTISVARTMPFERAHAVSEEVERRVEQMIGEADVVVHMEPRAGQSENIFEVIHAAAQRRRLNVHDLDVHQLNGQLLVDLHLEVPATLTLGEAHRVASELETEVRREVPAVSSINAHIETHCTEIQAGDEMRELSRAIQKTFHTLIPEFHEVRDCHEVTVRHVEDKILVSCHCTMDGSLPIGRVHDVTGELETRLKEAFPQVFRVTIHPEPPEES